MNATYPLCMLYIPSNFLRKCIFFHMFVLEENNNDSEKYLDWKIDGEREFSDSSFLAINIRDVFIIKKQCVISDEECK